MCSVVKEKGQISALKGKGAGFLNPAGMVLLCPGAHAAMLSGNRQAEQRLGFINVRVERYHAFSYSESWSTLFMLYTLRADEKCQRQQRGETVVREYGLGLHSILRSYFVSLFVGFNRLCFNYKPLASY